MRTHNLKNEVQDRKTNWKCHEDQNDQHLCPHGRVIVNELAYCGICMKIGDDAADFDRFLMNLHSICLIAANAVWSPVVLPEDRHSHAFLAVLTNLRTVIESCCPSAMAYTVAKRSLINLTMRAMNKNELPVSHVVKDVQIGREAMSVSDKLEFLDSLRKDEYARPDEPSRVVYFPGKQCVWKPRYLHHLETSVEKAFRLLPVSPVRQSLAVKLWLGMVPQRKSLRYKEIAKLFNIAERRARYEVQKGLLTLRVQLGAEAS